MKGLLKGVRSRLKTHRRSSVGARQGREEIRERDLPRSVSPNDETAAVANSTPSPRTMESVPSDHTSQEGVLVSFRFVLLADAALCQKLKKLSRYSQGQGRLKALRYRR